MRFVGLPATFALLSMVVAIVVPHHQTRDIVGTSKITQCVIGKLASHLTADARSHLDGVQTSAAARPQGVCAKVVQDACTLLWLAAAYKTNV